MALHKVILSASHALPPSLSDITPSKSISNWPSRAWECQCLILRPAARFSALIKPLQCGRIHNTGNSRLLFLAPSVVAESFFRPLRLSVYTYRRIGYIDRLRESEFSYIYFAKWDRCTSTRFADIQYICSGSASGAGILLLCTLWRVLCARIVHVR